MIKLKNLFWWLLLSMVLQFTVQPVCGMEFEAFVVWSQARDSKCELKVSRKMNQRWSVPETIEKSERIMLSPSLSMMKNGNLSVFWTEFDGVHGRIHYKIWRNGVRGPRRSLVTTTYSDFAPASIVDPQGVIWLVWAGTDETDDDIYFSRWINNHWQKPKMVNTNDAWPDILPSIIIDSQNQISASWLGYDGDAYVRYSSSWTGKKWSHETVSDGMSTAESIIEAYLPDFIPEEGHGRIFFGASKPFRTFIKRSAKKPETTR